MKRKVSIAKSFKKDMAKQVIHLATAEWAEVLNCLVQKIQLPEKYRDHALTGNFKGYRDCHVKPDLVLVYKLHDDEVELHHLKTHSELFG